MIDKSELLPIGSVIRLIGSDLDRKMMIVNRIVLSNQNGEEGYFEYAGCPHIIGAVEGQLYYFNAENIEEVCFKGYVDGDEVEYQLRYQAFLENKLLKKLSVGGK